MPSCITDTNPSKILRLDGFFMLYSYNTYLFIKSFFRAMLASGHFSIFNKSSEPLTSLKSNSLWSFPKVNKRYRYLLCTQMFSFSKYYKTYFYPSLSVFWSRHGKQSLRKVCSKCLFIDIIRVLLCGSKLSAQEPFCKNV